MRIWLGDAIRCDGEGNVGADVDEKLGGWAVSAESCEQLAGEFCKVGGRKILLAELNEVDTGGGEAGGLVEQGDLASGMFSGKADTVGNGAGKHSFIC